ncbi:MAG: alpha/beta fold hydrolase [Candidatus Acidiferrales bacterium]
MQDLFADVNSIRLHAVAEGSGPLILFLHGFPEFWSMWRQQLSEFGHDHLALAPDMRGYNLSSRPARTEDYELPVLVEDIRALAAHFGYRRFTLVGHDWGGVVAWCFALAHPECLDALAILNAPHPAIFERELRTNPAQRLASRYIAMFRTPLAEYLLSRNNFDALLKAVHPLGNRDAEISETVRAEYIRAWSQPGALTGMLNYYRAMPATPPRGDPPRTPSSLFPQVRSWVIETPTLVIWGEQDRFLLPGLLRGLEGFTPNISLHRVPGASHWIVRTEPEVVNHLLRDFLRARQL